MKTKKNWINVCRLAVFLTPFVIGTIGFYQALGDGVLNSMYRAMCLYFTQMDCEYSQVTPLVEVARWTAPLMSVAAIFSVLGLFFSQLKDMFRVHTRDAVAIHGDSKYVELLASRLGQRAILGETPTSMKAGKQVLIFNEDRKMFSYLDEHRRQLLDGHRKVYLCSERIVRGNYKDQNIVLCNFAENCARKFWKRYPLRMEPREEQIVIIGFNSYGQEILTQALLTNVYRTDSRITYHVFGASQEYRRLHTEWDQFLDINADHPTRDCVYFHEDAWYDSLNVIREADRIILADDQEERNLLLLNTMNKYFVTGTIYIRVTNRQILAGLWDQNDGKLFAFGTEEGLCTPEVILDEVTLDEAKKIHSQYFRAYQCPKYQDGTCSEKAGACYRCPLLLTDWNSLNSFLRYSNVAQADHVAVKIHLLLGDGYREIPHAGAEARKRFEAMSPEERLVLYEIEHIRWARYHYMNNWSYAPVRDNKNRKHHLLVPFEQLSHKEKLKDEDTWRTAFALYDEETAD